MGQFSRYLKETAVGLAASVTPVVKRVQNASTEHVEQQHELHESLQLLNAMRLTGGVRRIAAGNSDNGAPVGQLSEKVLRHVDFESLNNHIQNGTEYSPNDSSWRGYGSVIESNISRPSASPEQLRQAAANLNRPTQVRTLQDELLGT